MKTITVDVHDNGQGQFVYIPEEFRLSENKLFIKKIDDTLMLIPVDKEWETHLEGLFGFTDCFFPNGREPQGEHGDEENLWDAL